MAFCMLSDILFLKLVIGVTELQVVFLNHLTFLIGSHKARDFTVDVSDLGIVTKKFGLLILVHHGYIDLVQVDARLL